MPTHPFCLIIIIIIFFFFCHHSSSSSSIIIAGFGGLAIFGLLRALVLVLESLPLLFREILKGLRRGLSPLFCKNIICETLNGIFGGEGEESRLRLGSD